MELSTSAIDRIAEMAVAAERTRFLPATGCQAVPAVIIGNEVKSLESLQLGRARFRGKFLTSVLTEFATYVKAAPGGAGFIDPKKCAAKVFLNLGTAEAPGHCDWTATLGLDPVAAYAGLLSINGQQKNQRQLVEWIEDWAPNLQAQYGENAEPSSLSTAVTAFRNLTIASSKEVTHTDKDFGASKSALEQIEAKSAEGIPTHLIFTTTPFPGFQPRDFRLRVAVGRSGDTPTITLRMVSAEAVQEDIAREFKAMVLEQIGDAVTMIIGEFSP